MNGLSAAGEVLETHTQNMMTLGVSVVVDRQSDKTVVEGSAVLKRHARDIA